MPTGLWVHSAAMIQPASTATITPMSTQRCRWVSRVPMAGTSATAATMTSRDVCISPFTITADVACEAVQTRVAQAHDLVGDLETAERRRSPDQQRLESDAEHPPGGGLRAESAGYHDQGEGLGEQHDGEAQPGEGQIPVVGVAEVGMGYLRPQARTRDHYDDGGRGQSGNEVEYQPAPADDALGRRLGRALSRRLAVPSGASGCSAPAAGGGSLPSVLRPSPPRQATPDTACPRPPGHAARG